MKNYWFVPFAVVTLMALAVGQTVFATHPLFPLLCYRQ